ncbi:hypothetical protein AMATHDRAFT_74957 [Amanita thiersii Skay4041]|uniref:Uncharacterized protein n=1 Tax=Amanita thiersii Skay4041 TaxID=703135 RepID=A0A2A9NUT7_9AGAR|nr:hypothetical protein AMATHDRAFT_74957 [Amanita thiersii Skay4041]
MPTSELSNALNPYANQERPRQPHADYAAPIQQVIQPPQQYVPHRSELELAMAEPRPIGVNAVHELVRLISETRDAHEIERKRRLAWEREQEAKLAQKQAETERLMLETQQEIQTLRAMLSRKGFVPDPAQQAQQAPIQPSSRQSVIPATGLFTPHYSMSPAMHEQSVPIQPTTPLSPVGLVQPSTSSQPSFIEGFPNASYSYTQQPYVNQAFDSSQQTGQVHQSTLRQQSQPQSVCQHGIQIHQSQINQPRQSLLVSHSSELSRLSGHTQSVTPSPSPQLIHADSRAGPVTSIVSGRKRTTAELSNDEGDSMSSDESDVNPVVRIRRTNHHDRRCLTIHHAMRLHLLRCMELETDKQLPDSHIEGASLDPTKPVRFVWDKTTKQSVHNSRMKTRILSDIKSKRVLYKHVPDKDFSKKTLEAAFEQCFTTFRQKFKAQRDAVVATNLKQREDQKARKARHLSRRKIKLSNRAEARMKIEAFEHVTFDGALQLECMSSEDSDYEMNDPASSESNGVLRTRGYAWRSTRLIKFYCILDNEERVDKSTKPKRGLGKKGRRTGALKEGFYLPPKGVATWMISRRWLHGTQHTHPDLPEILNGLVDDPPGFDWDQFDVLGLESDIERDDHDEQQQQGGLQLHDIHMHELQNALQMPQPHYSSTSSLNYALM